MTSTEEFRIEHDTMGEVRVPVNALYRAQTQRAVENFPISGKTLERAHIEALARVKKAAAQANAELGVLDGELAKAIADAADEVAAGKYDGDFPIDVFQTGSGTSSNMNTNEVLAELATRALKAAGSDKVVHPNDHVNASQSSNDVFPTSVHVAATSALLNDLIPALGYLAESLERKAAEFKDVVKSGRTHLMDATPVTLGQEFGGYAAQVRYGIERINAALPRVAEVPLGGTAVGTGINPPAGFPERVIELLATDTGLPLTEARDHFEAQANRDDLIEAYSQLRNIAISFMKINNDLRWMGSGPNGAFDLNVGIPVMAATLLESGRLLANTSRVMADKMIDGITANAERARFLAEASPSIVTPLNKFIGYENAAKIAKTAVKEGLTVRQATEKLGFVGDGEGKVSEADLEKALDVTTM